MPSLSLRGALKGQDARTFVSCPLCGAQNFEGFNFCQQCGRKQLASPTLMHKAPTVAPATNDGPPPMPRSLWSARKEQKQREPTRLGAQLIPPNCVKPAINSNDLLPRPRGLRFNRLRLRLAGHPEQVASSRFLLVCHLT